MITIDILNMLNILAHQNVKKSVFSFHPNDDGIYFEHSNVGTNVLRKALV